jgi:hypothetical protein
MWKANGRTDGRRTLTHDKNSHGLWMFRLIAIDFSQKSPHFSLLFPISPCELFEREVTSPSNLKVVGALDNYSLVFVIFKKNFGQLKDWVGQVLFLVSCPKGQVKHNVNVEVCRSNVTVCHYFQIRGRSDFSFRELTWRSGRQQREMGRLLREVNCD